MARTNADRPTGKVKVVGVTDTRPGSTHAVYVEILVEDEAGKRWSFSASSFLFDLKAIDGS